MLAAAAAGGAALLLRSPGPSPVSGPRLAWTAQLPSPDMNVQPVSDTTVLCVGSPGAACFDLATGKPLWHESDGSTTAAKGYGGLVYALRTDGKVHALDARTGSERWSAYPAGTTVAQLQYADASLLVVTDRSGTFHAFDATTGAARWSRAVDGGQFLTGATSGGQMVLNAMSSTPGVGDVYTVVSRDTGTPLWTAKGLQELYTPPTGDLLYAIDSQENLQALAADTGTARWSRPSGLPATVARLAGYFGSLQLQAGTLFCNPDDDTYAATSNPSSGLLAAFDPATGAPSWQIRGPIGILAGGYDVTGGTVGYVDKLVHGVDQGTGRLRWTAGAGIGTWQFLGAAGGLLIAAAGSGRSGTQQGPGLFGFTPDTGHQAWYQPLTGATGDWATAKASGALLASCAGTLFCLADTTALNRTGSTRSPA
ncbi:PQQ-binding-like beta-propeller repeat protein [Streptacidiphilus sp. 4-A2]|nr:PQQ-binding-like beta-propeller repeat protein [Streptacidiphilus sp. 4-A2]